MSALYSSGQAKLSLCLTKYRAILLHSSELCVFLFPFANLKIKIYKTLILPVTIFGE
jgi:hypothetical protein